MHGPTAELQVSVVHLLPSLQSAAIWAADLDVTPHPVAGEQVLF
jgi:hypothetical protein